MGKIVWACVVAAGVAGCQSGNKFDQRYAPSRADLPDQALPNSPPAVERPAIRTDYPPLKTIVNPEPTTRQPAAPAEAVVTGTWTFITPSTVTRTMKKNGEIMQYSLFAGRPAANDLPMVVVTVAPPTAAGAPKSQAEADPATYKVGGTRNYVLNGNIAQEWTGTTSTGSAFSELLLKRPGANPESDVCHVMATARTTEERKTALEILGSLTWKAAGQ